MKKLRRLLFTTGTLFGRAYVRTTLPGHFVRPSVPADRTVGRGVAQKHTRKFRLAHNVRKARTLVRGGVPGREGGGGVKKKKKKKNRA